MHLKLDFYTNYSQFYVYDAHSPFRTDAKHFWTDEAHEHRLAVEEGVLGVATECYGPVKGELKILEQENLNVDLTLFDHIVEGALEIKSGVVQILDCPHSSVIVEVPLPCGIYRVRIYSSNLKSVVGDEGDDFYTIEIWPGTGPSRHVIKQWGDLTA